MRADAPRRGWLTPRAYLPLRLWEGIGTGAVNLFTIALLGVYLFPILFMAATSLMHSSQLEDRFAPPWPGTPVTMMYEGEEAPIYKVPLDGVVRELALVERGPRESKFADPANPAAGLITWEGSWRTLPRVYRFRLNWQNFVALLDSIPFPKLIRNTLLAAAISGVGVLASSIVVAYGFARYPLPGGNALFYLMIATLLIPEKVTLIPAYFFFVRVLEWNGSWLPILIPFFFGNALYIFLLRQNFKTVPKELEEAAMLDGAGALRTLFSVVLPQTWPTLVTVTILHFFYMWNETRLASIYLASRRDLIPISFGIANFQSLAPIQNLLQASALITMIVPVIVLLISQRVFLRDMVITGAEKRARG